MAAPLTTLHLWGVSTRRVPAAVLRMATDRRRLRRTEGLRFWKLLGTGSGQTFTLRDADVRRWGLLSVWESADALSEFEGSSPVVSGWEALATERWRADLLPVRSKGLWSGVAPFEPVDAPVDGTVAVLTRARLRLTRSVAFHLAVPPVAAAASEADGLQFAIGIGEAPVGLQATFTVWRDAASIDAYAFGTNAHVDAIRRTRSERWYSEELFARFTVVSTQGTVGGVDPIA